MEEKDYKYEEFIDSPLLQSIFPEPIFNYMSICGDKTGEVMEDTWKKNTDKNSERLLPKHGMVGNDLLNIAKNKAVIIVGAGPSFNKNKDILKAIYDFNVRFKIEDQPFLIIASNHQLKPLLEMGIFPHLTVILDGGNHFRHQFLNLPTDMKCVILSNIAADHKMLKRLDRDGHTISFFMSDSNSNRAYVREKLKADPEKICAFTGGNVLNAAFVLSLRYLHSRFVITIGNDLSFPIHEDIEIRRNSFYADKDYSTNTKDEARHQIAWMEFNHGGRGIFDPNSQLINYNKVLTSHQLLIYKVWIEMHIAKWSESDIKFRYYNCSEGGICGVLAKKHAVSDLENKNNWMLMDEVAPKRWFTKPLIDAFEDFMEIKRSCHEGIPTGTKLDARNVVVLPGKTDFARDVGLVGRSNLIIS